MLFRISFIAFFGFANGFVRDYIESSVSPNRPPIRFVSVIVGDNILYGYSSISAAYDVAFEEVMKKYPGVFESYIRVSHYQPGSYSCLEAANEMIVLMSNQYNYTLHYQYHGPVVILAPGCSNEINAVGDFCREYDWLVMGSSASDGIFGNRERFPSVLALGPAAVGLVGQALRALMHRNGWITISVIYDNASGDPILPELGRILENYFASYIAEVNSLTVIVNSTRRNATTSALRKAKAYSSIILLLVLPDYWKDLMAAAADLGMNNGKFVFLATRFPDTSTTSLSAGLWNTSDVITTKSRLILPYFFEITALPPPSPAMNHVWDVILDRAVDYYHQELPEGWEFQDTNPMQLSAYEAIHMLAEVLNETYDSLHLESGSFLAKQFYNRTFWTPAASVKVTPRGTRASDVYVSQYDNYTYEPDLIWLFDSELSQLIYQNPNDTLDWPGGKFPPSSSPPCDPSVSFCPGPQSASGSHILDAVVVVLVAVIFGGLVLWYMRRRAELKNSSWWLIPYDEVTEKRAASRSFRIAGTDVDLMTQHGFWTTEDAVYKGKLVHATHFLSEKRLNDVIGAKRAVGVLKAIKDLEHPNLGRVYGLSFPPTHAGSKYFLAVCEYPSKGYLRQYIDQDDLSFNWDLRYSLLWDLLSGLRFLRRSSLRCHGVLSGISLIIDEHFTLKIARPGILHFHTALQTVKNLTEILPRISLLWMAPEVLIDPSKLLSPVADIYSLGVIVFEMGTRSTPFNVNVSVPEHIEAFVQHVEHGKLDPKSYKMPQSPPAIMDLVHRSWSLDPEKRPTLSDYAYELHRAHPHHNASFADNLMRRLQKYNLELETVVNVRTVALREEMGKVDGLLLSLLPETIARDLRDKKFVEPQFFESVTILFCDLPLFKEITEKCPPLHIVNILHGLYSALDSVISVFDVYKVETIADSYMLASGLPVRNGLQHASQIAHVALKMLTAAAQLRYLVGDKHVFLHLRAGVNSGPCAGVVIGKKLPHFCVVGDTVNTASRMETNGEESRIQLTENTKCLLDVTGVFVTECRGIIRIKGKGEMTTYWLVDVKEPNKDLEPPPALSLH